MVIAPSDHTDMLRRLLAALDPDTPPDALRVDGRASLASRYPASGLACAGIGAAALMLARWARPGEPPAADVDRSLASWWFGFGIRPLGWTLPDVRDAVTGDYAARDGWIRLYANAAHHRRRALAALGLPDDAVHAFVADRIRRESAGALEDAIVDRGGCAAALRAPQAWLDHPQGRAVAAEPLAHRLPGLAGTPDAGWLDDPDPGRPLAGIRVLDLTRVLAGPVATRFLAAYGARVLRLDPEGWDEPGMVPEVTVGKRCAFLDLRRPDGMERFRALLARADVLVHGYRPGALDALGLDRPLAGAPGIRHSGPDERGHRLGGRGCGARSTACSGARPVRGLSDGGLRAARPDAAARDRPGWRLARVAGADGAPAAGGGRRRAGGPERPGGRTRCGL